MLQIRGDQLATFDRTARENFERELVDHLKEFIPLHAAALGDDGLLNVVRLALDRAAAAGFTLRGPIRLYLDLMVKCGSGFATDPQLPWAAKALADRTGGEMDRADRLHGAYLAHDEKVVGPESEYARAAAKKAAALKTADLDLPPGTDRTAAFVAKAQAVYPQKAAAVGDAALAGLLPLGERRAAQYGLTTPKSGLLFAVLIFACGHQIDTDPVYPWVNATLTSDRADDPDRRIERVASKTLTFAARATANLARS